MRDMKVHILDVGHGDSIVLEIPLLSFALISRPTGMLSSSMSVMYVSGGPNVFKMFLKF